MSLRSTAGTEGEGLAFGPAGFHLLNQFGYIFLDCEGKRQTMLADSPSRLLQFIQSIDTLHSKSESHGNSTRASVFSFF